MSARPKALLITVGTTGFDSLIKVACSEVFVETIASLQFSIVYMQYGSSAKEYDDEYYGKYNVSTDFRLHTLDTDSSFWLLRFPRGVHKECGPSHRSCRYKSVFLLLRLGAGTILDSLRAKRHLVVVVNESLMGNHQHEIADAMAEKNYLLKSTPETLCSNLKRLPKTVFTPYCV